MKKLLLSLLCAGVLQAVTLTGTLKGPDGTGRTGTLIFTLAQQEALSSTGSCGGPAEIVPVYQVKITVTAGALVSPPAIYGNDCLMPQGSFYNITFLDPNGNIIFTDRWQLSGTTVDIGTIVSVVISGTTQSLGTPGVIFTVPIGNQTINQSTGTNLNVNLLNVTDTLTLPNGGICNVSGCGGLFSNVVDITSAQTISGQKTFTADILPGPATSLGTLAHPFQNGDFYGTLTVLNASLNAGLFTQTIKLTSFNSTSSFDIGFETQPNQLNILDNMSHIIGTINTASSPANFASLPAIFANSGMIGQPALTVVGIGGLADTSDLFRIYTGGVGVGLVFNVRGDGAIFTNGLQGVTKTCTALPSVSNGIITSC